jgi:two-component system response regulator YesN
MSWLFYYFSERRNMLNLIIVDDEETTRNSLLELVPWAMLGIEAVKTAENGLAALMLAEIFTPSILLTDIRMPKMNGIDLAKNIRQLYPACEIIFLSGFSDKEYLKSAIQLNAVDYLEKPIDMEELRSLFIRTVQKLLDDQRKFAEDIRLKNHFHENIHLLRQDMTLELVLHQADLYNLLGRYKHEVLQLSTEGYFTVLCVLFNWTGDIQADDKALIKNNILKQLNEKGHFAGFHFLSGFVNDNYLVFIINEKIDSTTQRCKAFWENLFKLLLKESQSIFTFAAGCSASSTNLHSIPDMYKSAFQILKQQFYQGSYKVFYSPPLPVSSYEMDKELYIRFKKLLRSGSTLEVNNLVIQLTKDISLTLDPDTSKIKNIYFTLLRILFEVMMQWDIVESEDDTANKYIWQELDDKKTLNELSGLLLVNIETVLKKTENKEASIDKMDEIKKYIMNNYANNQLSIQSIATYAYLSQTYLCACFKKATGKTINGFITELRIEKAKELILDRKIKLYEVSTHIGFSDANYFSTLFKKYVGLTPSEFRERHIYDK